MKIQDYIRNNIGYIIIVGGLLFFIMYSAIEAGDYKKGIIMCLIVFIIILLLKNNELKQNLSRSEQSYYELIKELEKQGLIKEVEDQPKEKYED